MFTAIKNNKIIAVSDTDNQFKFLVKDTVETDSEHTSADYVMIGDQFVLSSDSRAIEAKKESVRAIRNQYLETYVDPKQMVLVWDNLSNDDKLLYSAYRTYLLNYPESSATWYENAPLNYDDWYDLNSASVIQQGGGNASTN